MFIKCLNDIQRRDAGSIKEYWQSDRGSVALNISQEILDTVYNKIVEKNFEPDFSIKDLLSDKDNQFSKWQDIYTNHSRNAGTRGFRNAFGE